MSENQGDQRNRRGNRAATTGRLLVDGAGRLGGVRRGLPSAGKGCLALLVAFVLVLILVGGLTEQVDAAEACAVTRFGKIVGEAGPGLHFKAPIVERYHCFRTAATFYEVLEDEFRSDADYTDGVLDGVTRDGQPLTLTVSVRYRVPRDNVGEIYESVARTMDQVNEKVIKFHTRAIVRQVSQRYTAAEIYSGDLAAISRAIETELAPRFLESGVVLEYFEIKRPRFQPQYEQAIEAKQIAKEEIETKANQAKAAEQDALRSANLAQGEADAERIRAQGESDAIALRGKAVRENPEVISLNYLETLKTVNWAILDSSNFTPFLTIPTPNGGSATASPPPTPTAEPTPTS
ncbi:MAG: prohibitin 2 [Thermomicrobiales bacterium]|nr:prohibitin 2 [Thermomicrobiales bacterium]